MKRAATLHQQRLIQAYLSAGLTPSMVARTLKCSRQSVYNVVKYGVRDRRDSARGGASPYPDLGVTVRALRADYPHTGPRLLFHILKRDPARWAWTDPQLPSPATIGRTIRALGLATKPVGPRDNRRYPHDDLDGPGAIALDTWGPWHVRAARLYLASVQDRFTRFTAAIPSSTVEYGGDGALIGFPQRTWATAIVIAIRHFLNGQPLRTVMADNGVGLKQDSKGCVGSESTEEWCWESFILPRLHQHHCGGLLFGEPPLHVIRRQQQHAWMVHPNLLKVRPERRLGRDADDTA